jgi:hypothetical protein
VRKLRVVAVLVGLLGVSLVAVGVANAVQRSRPSVTARVAPSRINAPPFAWTTFGSLVLPKQVCPNGATVFPYCEPTPASACSGKMSLTVKLGRNPLLADSGKKVASKSLSLRSCGYSFDTKLPKSVFTSKKKVNNFKRSGDTTVKVSFSVSYGGNSLLTGASARTRTAVAAVINK